MLSDAIHRALEALDDWARIHLDQDADITEHDRLVSAVEDAIRTTMIHRDED